jgi:glycine/D-amino acid oxidase-like deaminating enzyme
MSMRVLICGGGVIGASIAYFMSRRGVEATVVERTGLACAASGKSGGFLALDWCDGSPLAPLARRSFVLHARLTQEIDDDWGYRRLDTYGGSMGLRHRGAAYSIGWLSPGAAVDRRLGSTTTTAQVHPGRFTNAMMRAAQAQGAKLHLGQVTAVVCRGSRVAGVEVDGQIIEVDIVVVAMGPWSILAASWLPLPPIFGLKGHSLIFETGSEVPGEALFLEYRERTGRVQSPELFPRPDGTTYVCAISGESPLPINPAEVHPDRGAIERLERMCTDLSPVLASSRVLARQACYRPITRDGLPLIGRLARVEGAYVATGHNVWGILNAPATAEAMSELIVDGAARAVDLQPFDPGRFVPLDPTRFAGL